MSAYKSKAKWEELGRETIGTPDYRTSPHPYTEVMLWHWSATKPIYGRVDIYEQARETVTTEEQKQPDISKQKARK